MEQPQHTLTFVGTATTLLRLGRFTLLTDPNLLHRGERAYLGKGLWSRRLTEPALPDGGLPRLDAVVLSHLHGDHWDRRAEAALRPAVPAVPVVTTPQAAQRLSRKGFATVALDTWQRHCLVSADETLRLESLPAVHAYGVMGRLLPPVMGTLVEHRHAGRTTRVYLSGDTLTGEHLDEIARRHPEIDLAVVHLGGTRVLLHTVTLDAAGGVDLLRRIRPRHAVPVHYDDYGVFRSRLPEFEDAVRRAGLADRVRVAPRGRPVPVGWP